MGRVVKFTVVDAGGAGASGQKLRAGEVELVTTSSGQAQALLDDGTTVIMLNGKKVYEGPVEALRPVEVFTTSGERRV